MTASLTPEPEIREKACRKCGLTKPLDEFRGKADGVGGRTARCRECLREEGREYRQTRQNQDAQRAARRRWAQRNRAKILANERRSVEENHAKYLARWKLKSALRSGKVVRGEQCVRCGAGGRIEGHHEDYAKPLDVEWLCVPCHGLTRRAA